MTDTDTDLKYDRDLAFIMRLVAFCALWGLLLAWPLFIPSARTFGLAPVFAFLNGWPAFFDWVVYLTCVACLLWVLVAPDKRFPAAVALGCTVLWVLQDLNRMLPNGYMYCYTLLVTAWSGVPKANRLNALRLMVCGVYFWAGFHKINATFYTNVFPWFLQPIHDFSASRPASLLDAPFVLALWGTPFFESFIGILLLFPRWQKLATAMALIMLLVVLFCLGPFGHDWALSVWPWNIYLFFLEFRLFFCARPPAYRSFSHFRKWEFISIALFIIAPGLAIITPWYSLPGFKVYSGNTIGAEIVVAPQDTLAKAPAYLKRLVKNKHLSLALWAETEMKNSFYPVPYAIKMSARGLCPYLDDPADARLHISFPPPFYSRWGTMQEMPLCP